VSPQGELRAEGVTKSFGKGHLAVAGVDATFSVGVRTGIVGESGSGKSTLARMLVGLETPTAGEVSWRGRAVASLLGTRLGRVEFRREVQFVGQDTTSSFDPRHTLRHAVTTSAQRLLDLPDAEARAAVDATLSGLGLDPAMADRMPGQVSGGQRQRFAIARALVVGPRLMVCDEIVSALDVSVQGAILNMIKRRSEETGTGVVFVSHGLPATAFLSDEIVVMFRGEIVERAAAREVVQRPAHEYTQGLLAAHRPRAAA
jgi:ABC-type dipeptide/oligopeptide/nickel transport system ATPase subunit